MTVIDIDYDTLAEDTTYDFTVQDAGSFVILYAVTGDAVDWAATHLPADAQQWCGGTVIERRYFDDIADGILADGLTVI